ncbi:MAG: hypothetical protein LBT86_10625 [Deltaproteobacteria bacterium]|jgi:hypothetical protein|nr:hypothetical protein [Deltaproteobacteria bacterium]
MFSVSKLFFYAFFLPLLAMAALIRAQRAEAGVLSGSPAQNSLSAAADTLSSGQALNAEGKLGSSRPVSGRSDYFDDRRDDKRYPNCKRVQNHDTKRCRERVVSNYFSHKPGPKPSHGKFDNNKFDHDKFEGGRDDRRYP